MCLLKDQTENYSKWVNINRAMNKSHILKAANSEMSSVEPPKPAMDIISVQVKQPFQCTEIFNNEKPIYY